MIRREMAARVTARQWLELIDVQGFLDASDYTSQTKDTYGRFLQQVNDWLASEALDIHGLDPAAFDRFLESRRNWTSRKTAKSCLDAIKAYLAANYPDHPLRELTIIPDDPPPGRKMTQAKLDKILASLPDSRAGVQYRAMLWVLWCSWIRVSELGRMRLEYLDLERRQFDVLTKGGAWETKRLSEAAIEALRPWLRLRKRLADPDCPTVFCSTVTGQPFTRDGLRGNFYRLGDRAGVRFSAHDFRRGGPSHAAERGMPDRLGMLQGGWRDHEQYRHYTRGAELRAVDQWLPGNNLEKSEGPVTAGPSDGVAGSG